MHGPRACPRDDGSCGPATTCPPLRQKQGSVNKTELIDNIAVSADISKAAAGKALDGVMEAITDALKQGDSVSLGEFGSFNVKEHAVRSGRDPKTGEKFEIAASKTAAFTAGRLLKAELN
ncbi:HU family DNA-binding protein [Streptomyces populi]